MRLNMLPSSILSLFAVTLLQPVSAGLIPDLLDSLQDLQNLVKRCDNPCGYYGQLCCASDQYCYTDANNQAQCGSGGGVVTTTVYAASAVQSQSAGGSWRTFTTTYVQTDLKTVTATYSTYVAGVTTAVASSCQWSLGQTPCGNACCNSGQFCQQLGVCANVPGSSGYYSSLATVTVTNTASAPLRPTSNSVTTLTSTGHASSTTAFQTPVGTGGATAGVSSQSTKGGLSGGAIAGIVIGVILGIILLLLICACCCFKGLLDGLLSIFGLGPRRRQRREEVEVYEERRHSTGGGGGRTWFGTRPGGGTVTEEKRKRTGGGFASIAGVGAFLAGLAVILGLKRKNDERRDDKTGSSYSYYDSEYYSSSSSSSAGRTRGSRSRSRSRI